VAEAPYSSPLLALIAPQLARQGGVGFLMEAATAADLLPPALLPPAVEYYTATADQTAGHDPTLDAALDRALPWTDRLCAAGSTHFLHRLKHKISAVRSAGPAGTLHAGFAQALAPVPLPCGMPAEPCFARPRPPRAMGVCPGFAAPSCHLPRQACRCGHPCTGMMESGSRYGRSQRMGHTMAPRPFSADPSGDP